MDGTFAYGDGCQAGDAVSLGIYETAIEDASVMVRETVLERNRGGGR